MTTDNILRASYSSEHHATLIHAINDDGMQLLCAHPDGMGQVPDTLFDKFGRSHLGRLETLDDPKLRVALKAAIVGNPLRDIEQLMLKAQLTMSEADFNEFNLDLNDLMHNFDWSNRPAYVQ